MNYQIFRQSLNEIQTKIHMTAVEKGWWQNKERSPLEIQMLIVSELAEACEEARKGTPAIYQVDGDLSSFTYGERVTPKWENWDDNKKPEGELIELADAVIRILDYCGHKGWDLGLAIHLKMKYNETREHRHGGKKF